MSHIENGARVVAVHQGSRFNKGEAGVLTGQGGIDSEYYYFVQLDNGPGIGPSLSDYWEAEPVVSPTP